jgi:Flp pilus assembly protein TadG
MRRACSIGDMCGLHPLLGRSAQSRLVCRDRHEAQALVELAIVLVALCSLFLAAFDFGQAMNIYLVTVHATREAARVATVAGTSVGAVQAAAQNAAGDTVASSSLSVSCQAATFNASSGTYVTTGGCPSPLVADTAFALTVSTTVTPMLPFTGLLFGSLSLGPIPVNYTLVGIVEPNS